MRLGLELRHLGGLAAEQRVRPVLPAAVRWSCSSSATIDFAVVPPAPGANISTKPALASRVALLASKDAWKDDAVAAVEAPAVELFPHRNSGGRGGAGGCARGSTIAEAGNGVNTQDPIIVD